MVCFVLNWDYAKFQNDFSNDGVSPNEVEGYVLHLSVQLVLDADNFDCLNVFDHFICLLNFLNWVSCYLGSNHVGDFQMSTRVIIILIKLIDLLWDSSNISFHSTRYFKRIFKSGSKLSHESCIELNSVLN